MLLVVVHTAGEQPLLGSIEALANAYVQHEVYGYVRARKKAGDTLTGIVEWWVEEQRRSIGTQTVRAAVDELVARGKLKAVPLPGGDHLYLAVQPLSQTQQQE